MFIACIYIQILLVYLGKTWVKVGMQADADMGVGMGMGMGMGGYGCEQVCRWVWVQARTGLLWPEAPMFPATVSSARSSGLL